MAGQAAVEHLVVNLVGGGHQRYTGQLQPVHSGHQVVANQRNVLNAFAVELHQELFNLAAALLGLFVQGNADFSVRRGHGARGQTGVLALNIKVTDLAEVEKLLVKRPPKCHAPAVHVVREVVNQLQAVAHRVAVYPVKKQKVDVVDRFAVFKAVNQVQRRPANAFDGGQIQLHRSGLDLNGLRAQCQRTLVGQVRILDPKRHAACARSVLSGKVSRLAVGFAVDDEVDMPLAVQHHVFGAVPGHQREAHALKNRLQQARGGRGELDEFKAHQAHWVVKQVGHGAGFFQKEKANAGGVGVANHGPKGTQFFSVVGGKPSGFAGFLRERTRPRAICDTSPPAALSR